MLFEASNWPSGLNTRDRMIAACPSRARQGGSTAPGFQAARSHSRIVWSLPPVASVLPSGLTATAHTGPLWKLACGKRSLPVTASKTLTWSSPHRWQA